MEGFFRRVGTDRERAWGLAIEDKVAYKANFDYPKFLEVFIMTSKGYFFKTTSQYIEVLGYTKKTVGKNMVGKKHGRTRI